MESANISHALFSQIELRIGLIFSVERIPETDRLLKLSVQLGEASPRQIVSGIADYFPNPEVLLDKKCVVVANLAPRTIKGFKSNGMILAAIARDETFTRIVPEKDVSPGTTLH